MGQAFGKNNNALPLGTVDTSQFTQTINNAVQNFQYQQEQGLLPSLQGQLEAERDLAPYSATAKAAMDELNSMLGIDTGMQKTGLGSAFTNMADMLAAGQSTANVHTYQGMQRRLDIVGGLIDKADQIQDPTKRAAAKAHALKVARNLQNQIDNTFSSVAAAFERDPNLYPEAEQEMAVLTPIRRNLARAIQEFDTQYDPGKVKDPAKAQATLTDRLEQTPGYQFQMEQGQKALERSAAAKGMLKSGNFAQELQQYGQGMAQQTYQQHLQNLAQQAGMYLPSATQSGLLPLQGGQFQSNYGLQGATSRLGTLSNLGSNQAKAAIATAQNQTSLGLAGMNTGRRF